MTAYISAVTSGDGVIAYQDHADATQFYYVPQRVETILGGSLSAFKVDYWGMAEPYLVQDSDQTIRSMFGAIMSGSALFDIADSQREKLTARIKGEFNVDNPKLAPLRLKNPKLKPVWAEKTLSLGEKPDVEFPPDFQFGSQFNYLFGTGNSLFANLVASQNTGDEVIVNSHFGLNVVATAEFRGEPWSVTVDAELKSVWSEIRKHFSTSVSYGWFTIGQAEFNEIITKLERSANFKTVFDEGSLDTQKFGSQIFEMGKRMAEKIIGFSPWSVSINASHSERSFTQTFKYHDVLEYRGNFEAAIPASMTLAVACNEATKGYFNELNSAEPCVTKQKVENLQKRIRAEVEAKNAKLNELWRALLDQKINMETYERLCEYVRKATFTEGTQMRTFKMEQTANHPEILARYFEGAIHQAPNTYDELIAEELKAVRKNGG
jgi:hypothetical protein